MRKGATVARTEINGSEAVFDRRLQSKDLKVPPDTLLNCTKLMKSRLTGSAQSIFCPAPVRQTCANTLLFIRFFLVFRRRQSTCRLTCRWLGLNSGRLAGAARVGRRHRTCKLEAGWIHRRPDTSKVHAISAKVHWASWEAIDEQSARQKRRQRQGPG